MAKIESHFATGRMYDTSQVIEYSFESEAVTYEFGFATLDVEFNDSSRYIKGHMTLVVFTLDSNIKLPDVEQEILLQYDAGNYV